MTASASSIPWTKALRLQLRQILITKGSSMLVGVLLAPLVILARTSSPTNSTLEAVLVLVDPVGMPVLVAVFWGVEIGRDGPLRRGSARAFFWLRRRAGYDAARPAG